MALTNPTYDLPTGWESYTPIDLSTDLSSNGTVSVSPGNYVITGQQHTIPSSHIGVRIRLSTTGEYNIVIVGNTIDAEALPTGAGPYAFLIRDDTGNTCTGSVYIEGNRIGADVALAEGIDLDCPGLDAYIGNNYIELYVADLATYTAGAHCDIIQPFGGAKSLRVDGLTGRSPVQGLFIKIDHGDQPAPMPTYLKRVNIREETAGDGTQTGLDLLRLDGTSGDEGEMFVELGTVWIDTIDADITSHMRIEDASGVGQTITTGSDSYGTYATVATRLRDYSDTAAGRVYSGVPTSGDYVSASDVGVGYARRSLIIRRTFSLWSLKFATHPGGPLTVPLVDADTLELTVPLDGPRELSTSTDGRSVAAAKIGDWTTDLIADRDGERLFRGPVIPTDQLRADSHQVTLRAADYRWRLSKRDLQSDLSYSSTYQEAIGWGIIQHLQSRTGGDLGITRSGVLTHGPKRDRNYETGDNAGQRLDELGRVENGQDWEIGPDLVYRTWISRGAGSPLVLLWGGTVDEIDRTPDGSYANFVRVIGDDTTTSQTAQSSDLATVDGGRWDLTVGAPSVSQNATLLERAEGELDAREGSPTEWTCRLSEAAAWTPTRLWVGDTVRLVVDAGRLDVDTTLRVHQVRIRVDLASGDEQVWVSLGAPPADFVSQWRRLTGRISELERA